MAFLFFRDLESTGNYFKGFWEQVHSFGDLGRKIKEKPQFCLISGGVSPLRPPCKF